MKTQIVRNNKCCVSDVIHRHRARYRGGSAARLLILAGAFGVFVAAPAAAEDVLAGIDVWATPEGSWTAEFCAGCPECPAPPCNGTALPADFFGPGSDPFDGVIFLQGDPFPGQDFDSIVERLGDATLPSCPSSDTIDIEMVALSLVSSQPITVTYNGGQDPEDYDVRVCLSDVLQPVGSMTIQRNCQAGGFYHSTLEVLPKFVFTPTAGGPPLVFDAGLEGVPPLVLSATGAVWTDEVPPEIVVNPVPPGLQVDGNCDGVPDNPLPGTSNFVAGIGPGSCTCGAPPEPCRRIELTKEQAEYNKGTHNIQPPGFSEVSCCKVDATCESFSGENGIKQCEAGGGVALGGDGASCDVLGACCFEDLHHGSCVNTTKCCCEDIHGGVWQGPDTNCDPNPCEEDAIPTVSEWGLIVFTLLILTVATVALGRRRRRQAAAA